MMLLSSLKSRINGFWFFLDFLVAEPGCSLTLTVKGLVLAELLLLALDNYLSFCFYTRLFGVKLAGDSLIIFLP